jgi:hypothetical protein
MPLKQEALGILMNVDIYPRRPKIEELFELLFDNEVLASIAVAKISGFAPIPCYEIHWFYEKELPVCQGTPRHRAVLKPFGCMWRWEQIEDAIDYSYAVNNTLDKIKQQ